MQLYELIFTILIIYLLYKLVFNVVLPVAKVSSTVRDQMRHMQQEENMKQPANNNYTTSESNNKKQGASSTDSEYIDFEEIK